MNTKKIGEFLAELRREQSMTQEQLGQRLGITNKTISRWENGNYLPPAEMLQALSDLYGISINEILSGKRLSETDYRENAEENIKAVIDHSGFTLDEKISFYKRKWKKDHRTSLIGIIAVFVLLHILGWGKDGMELQLIATFFAFTAVIVRHNAMMVYVEKRAFDPPLNDSESWETNKQKILLKRFRITALLVLAVSVWVCIDLTCNYFSALVPQLNDGITIRGIFGPMIFGIDGHRWSVVNYFKVFITSLQVTGFTAVLNIILACLDLNRVKQ